MWERTETYRRREGIIGGEKDVGGRKGEVEVEGGE